jgi:hypothetical protein
MKSRAIISFFIVLGIVFFFQSAATAEDMIFFDANGNRIDQEQYQQYVSKREKSMEVTLKDGYDLKADGTYDPIELRKRRIEQWRKMRAHFNPESLPHKIEKPLEEKN